MVSLSRIFAPKDRAVFELLEQAGNNIGRCAELLDKMLADYPESAGLAREIRELEGENDQVTHNIIRHVNQTFVTPIDREDIHELASALDDVIDYAEEVSDFLGLYKIEAPMAQAQELAKLLHLCAREVDAALPKLRGSYKEIEAHTVEINRLENDADQVFRGAVAALFDHGVDPMIVIRWRDIYQRLENAIDATEHVANTLEGIVIKNA